MTTLAADRTTIWLTPILDAYRSGRPLALLFDYDGTLTPIVRHPSLARLPAANRERLSRLAALPDVVVGVVSGRALAEVRAFVDVEGLFYAGSGGLEMEFDGTRIEYPGADAFRRVQVLIEDDLTPVLARFPGTWVERKPVALAIHYRGLAPAASVRFQTEIGTILDRHPTVRYREVSSAIEVTPANGWDKGTAVELLLDRQGPDVLPIYFGDAPNDAEAMTLVARLAGGIAVGIGPDAPPNATHRLVSSTDLEAWLDQLVQELPPTRGLPARDWPSSLRRERNVVPTISSEVRTTTVSDPGREPASPDPTAPGLLIVEPNSAFRRSLAAAFGERGWRVWTTTDAAEAVHILQDHLAEIQAALVDLQLPGLQGMRLLTDLCGQNPDLVRCGMSADVSPYAAAAFRQLSTLTLFTKPLDVEAASQALRWLIGVDDGPEPPISFFP